MPSNINRSVGCTLPASYQLQAAPGVETAAGGRTLVLAAGALGW